MRRTIVATLLGSYLLVLLDLTLIRFHQPGAPPNWVPFETIAYYLRDGGWEMVKNLMGNVVAFVPLGFLVPALHHELRSVRHVTSLALTVSVLIEFLQYLTGHRVADVDDVLLNTLGGFVGYLAFAYLRFARTPDPLASPTG